MSELIKQVDVAEFFVEVHHIRGNVSKFELRNDPNGDTWTEVDVWDYRRAAPEFWKQAVMIERIVDGQRKAYAAETLAAGKQVEDLAPPLLRVTRNLELEKDMLDVTYHPSVDLRMIDLTYVKEYLND